MSLSMYIKDMAIRTNKSLLFIDCVLAFGSLHYNFTLN